MSETTTIKGTWWLPDNPDRKLVGEITYGAVAGAELSLYDHFFDELITDRFTVWGITIKGKPISLFNCLSTGMTMHMPGGRSGKISSTFGVIGGHYTSPDEMEFLEVTATLSHLFEWAWITGISFDLLKGDDKLHITQARTQDVDLGKYNGLPVKLEFTSKYSPGYGSFELTEYCHLQVSSREQVGYTELEEAIRRIQHFVALGVAKPIYALSIKAYVEPVDNIERKTYEIIRRIAVTSAEKKLMPHFMPFALPDLQPDPSMYVQSFFDKYEQLKPVCDLYFPTVYHSDMFVRQKFLALAHAVEAYHRVFIGGQYQSTEEYEDGLLHSLYAAIPDDIDKDFRASLKTKLMYLHEYSLRKRIQDMCEQFVDVLKPSLGKPKNFASATSELRNELTHAKVQSPEISNKGNWEELWLKCEQLSLLLEVCLMHQIGFSDNKIKELLPRNRRPERIHLNRK